MSVRTVQIKLWHVDASQIGLQCTRRRWLPEHTLGLIEVVDEETVEYRQILRCVFTRGIAFDGGGLRYSCGRGSCIEFLQHLHPRPCTPGRWPIACPLHQPLH